jgi:LL-diaminopimelate aminotransferase
MPGGTYFLYTPSPKGLASGTKFANAEEASQYLINEHSIVTVPWDDAGAFLRFSVTYEAPDEAAEDAIMRQTEARLKQISPQF